MNIEFSSTYTDASLNIALATKAGDNMTWNAETNTFNVTSVSSGTTSLTSANEGTSITISNGTINVRQVENSFYKLPYAALKNPIDKFAIGSVHIFPPVTGVPIEEIVGTDYNYMDFPFVLSLPDLIHNFTDFNSETTWRAKADSIKGFTYSFDTWFQNGIDGIWTANEALGNIVNELPSSYNTFTVSFGTLHTADEVRILINGVVKKNATSGQSSITYTQSYNAEDILRVEGGLAIMNANIIITLSNTNPTLYTINFPESTETKCGRKFQVQIFNRHFIKWEL